MTGFRNLGLVIEFNFFHVFFLKKVIGSMTST